MFCLVGICLHVIDIDFHSSVVDDLSLIVSSNIKAESSAVKQDANEPRA